MKYSYLLLLIFFNHVLNAQLAVEQQRPVSHPPFIPPLSIPKEKKSVPLNLYDVCTHPCECTCSPSLLHEDFPTLERLSKYYDLTTVKSLSTIDKQTLLQKFLINHTFENYGIHKTIVLALAYAGVVDQPAFNRIAKIALEKHDLSFMHFIFDQGVNPNEESVFHKDHGISIPLFFLARRPHDLDLCRSCNAHFDQTDKQGNTFLHHIAAKNSYGSPKVQQRKLALLKQYFTYFAQTKDTLVNIKNKKGNTPLSVACSTELDLTIISLFLEHGADPLIKNRQEDTIFDVLDTREQQLRSHIPSDAQQSIKDCIEEEIKKTKNIYDLCSQYSKTKETK